VFERFYRVLGTGAEGCGLGLAIVREIAQSHGAEVKLTPAAEGTGTIVRVVFPVLHAQGHAAAAKADTSKVAFVVSDEQQSSGVPHAISRQ
jgi:two-component system sensor histidine kinase TctE